MDFKAPQVVLDALSERLAHGVFGYSLPSDGLPKLLCSELKRRYHYAINEEHLVWLPGLETALTIASDAVGKRGDGVLCLSPIYPPFYTGPQRVGRKVTKLEFELSGGGWEVPWQRLEDELKTGQYGNFLFCNPHNPIGKVFDRWELERLGELCLRYGVIVCSDEVHGDLILNGKPHIPMASLSEEMAQNTVTMMAPSKTYNIAGLACGFAVIANDKLRQSYKISMRSVTPMVNALGYIACEAAYEKAEPWRMALLDYLKGNASFLCQFLGSEMPELSMVAPEATYLGWINCERFGVSDPYKHFKSYRLALSSGGPFGDSHYVRINFGCPRKVLEEGLDRMKQAYMVV
jgi:cystathionine beta-lyase